MTHRHSLGELLSRFYVAQANSDQTEGRGSMSDIGTFEKPQDAYDRAKNQGVMGCGDGDVLLRSYFRCEECPEIVKIDEQIYMGDPYSKKNLAGKGNYTRFMPDGWRDDYSTLAQDPDYDTYLRLKKRFES